MFDIHDCLKIQINTQQGVRRVWKKMWPSGSVRLNEISKYWRTITHGIYGPSDCLRHHVKLFG